MKTIHWTIAVAALAFVQATPAAAAQSDPEVIIYRFAGVTDNGAPDSTESRRASIAATSAGWTKTFDLSHAISADFSDRISPLRLATSTP